MQGTRTCAIGLLLAALGCQSPAARPQRDAFEAELASLPEPARTSPAPAFIQAVDHQAPAGQEPRPAPEALPVPQPFAPVPQDTALPPPARELGGTPRDEVAQPLTLRQVTESVYFAYPGLEAAMRELDIAAGRELAAYGPFDMKLTAESWNRPLGFYQFYHNVVKLEQNTWQGGGVFGQYQSGQGKWPVWYGDLETKDGGEFKLGLLQPLLRNRAIDGRRADIMQATLRRQQVEPSVQATILEMVRAGADAYWSWVAAGQAYDVQRELLQVTIERNAVYEARVAAGDLPRIDLVQNQQLIAQREARMVEARRRLEQAAIRLSLFLRDDAGQPLVPDPAWLPPLPEPSPPDPGRTDHDIAVALRSRPELRELAIQAEQAEVDLALGQNELLPALDATLSGAKDVGGIDKPVDDKGPFELEAGLFFEVPLQRRRAQGRIREAQGRLAQIGARRRLAENRIVIDVQDAHSAMVAAHQRWLRARENTALARQLVGAERQRFDAQDTDLLRVALQEAAAIEAEVAEIEALADLYRAEAAYRAALAADPLASEGP